MFTSKFTSKTTGEREVPHYWGTSYMGVNHEGWGPKILGWRFVNLNEILLVV